ncbi:MAG: HupE/UreJ family protein [Nevskiales bacterium]
MTGACVRTLAGVLLAGCALSAEAHPLAPALLSLQEQADGSYAVLWRSSVTRAQGVDVTPLLPEDCSSTQARQLTTEENQAVVQRWAVRCDARGLTAKTLAIEGLERSGINVILRIETRAGAVTQTLLDARRTQFIVPAPGTSPPVFRAYLRLGVEHLLLGFDHVLFVIGLMLLVRKLRPLVVTVTCFTAGHSVTLSLATLGVVQVNPALTELGIAVSILVLACELARPVAAGTSLLSRWPGWMSLAFGLLHGLGFAGALADVGLPQAEVPLALLAFNLGIEIGQLLLIAAILSLVTCWRHTARRIPSATTRYSVAIARTVPIYILGSLAAFWCFERMAAYLNA